MELQKLVYFGYAIGLLVALQPSYLHPDEHFQSLEILISKFTNASVTIPWEFSPQNAARSFVPLYLYYGPLFTILFKILNIENPIIVLSLVRLQNYWIQLLMIKYILKKFSNKKNGMKLQNFEFLITTSYVTWSLQTHSFSNSIETIILLIVLSIYNDLINEDSKENYLQTCGLGGLISLGVFNRMTFPAFILLPSAFVFIKYYRHHLKCFVILLSSFTFSSFLCCLVDTYCFNSDLLVISPLNNLLYNMSVSNLETHGLHPRFTHILINLPQLIGPLIILIIFDIKENYKNYFNNVITTSIMSGMLLLSVFQHQELRFLIPLVPLFFIKFKKISSRKWIGIWLLFNIFMGLIIGCFHQSGTIRVLGYFYKDNNTSLPTSNSGYIGTHIWWKTYMPPTWMYMNPYLTISTTNIVNNEERTDGIMFNVTRNHAVDLKGCDVELLETTIHNFLQNTDQITLIAPNSVRTRLMTIGQEKFAIVEEYHSYAHLDLDHFDAADLNSFIPGISSYSIKKKV